MIQNIAIKHLTVSRANVRQTNRKEDLAGLKASIAAHGLLQNLVGIASKKKGYYSILAGGRRLACLQELISDGVLPADAQVPVQILDETIEPAEASLAENFQRSSMNPADEAEAFALLVTKGMTSSDIAKRFGLTERHVKQRLRLAALAEPVLDALRTFQLTVDLAMAFTAATDTALQASVYRGLKDRSWDMTVRSIRAAMLSATIPGNDRLCLYVGRDAYLAAGGSIAEDLFADDDTTVWLDRALVEKLASAKLEQETQALVQSTGVAWIKPVLTPTVAWQDTQDLYEVRGEVLPTSEAASERMAVIEAELQDIIDREESDDATTEDNANYDALTEELEDLREPTYQLTPEIKATVGSFAVIDAQGQIKIEQRYYSKSPTTGAHNSPPAPRAHNAGTSASLSETLAADLARQRTQILQAHVAQDAGLAFDLAAYFFAERLSGESGIDLGTGLRHREYNRGGDTDTASSAGALLAQLLSGLDTSWRSGVTAGSRFDAFRALPEDARAAWFAHAIADGLTPSLNVSQGLRSVAFHDHVARGAAIEVSALWRPTAETYFGRVPKSRLLEILTEIGGAQLSARYGLAKKGDIAKALEALCAGHSIVDAEIREKARTWLPTEMRFDATERVSAMRIRDTVDEDELQDDMDASDAPNGHADTDTDATISDDEHDQTDIVNDNGRTEFADAA